MQAVAEATQPEEAVVSAPLIGRSRAQETEIVRLPQRRRRLLHHLQLLLHRPHHRHQPHQRLRPLRFLTKQAWSCWVGMRIGDRISVGGMPTFQAIVSWDASSQVRFSNM